MKNLLIACLLNLSFVISAHAADNTDLLRAVDDFIIPESIHLEQAMLTLDERAQHYCQQPSAETLASLRDGFHYGMDAWQSLQVIRFGPIQYALRQHRIQMWPDKRGTVGKHLAALLASQDKTALQADNFVHGSVAVQGLSALERLLYSDRAIDPYACQVIQAITHNLADIASHLVHDWRDGDESHRQFIATSPNGNAIYDSAGEVRSALLNNLHTQLQLIVDYKLLRPLGDSIEQARGKRAESWRSQRSLKNIRLNLRAVEQLYRITFAPELDNPALQAEIKEAFAASYQALDNIPSPLHLAVADARQRPTVEQLVSRLSSLKQLFAGDLPQGLGVPLGFNSLDGD